MHSLTHTHITPHLLQKHFEPSLAMQSSSAHWFWLRGSITGFRWGNDRLWLHGFGSPSGSEARERDRLQHHVYLPQESCSARLGYYAGLMMYNKSNWRRWCAVVLGDETLLSMKDAAVGIEVGFIHIHIPGLHISY